MLFAAISIGLSIPLVTLHPAGQKTPSSPDQVALERLEEAFGQQDSQARVEALAESGSVANPEVLKAVSRAMKDPSPAVRLAAIEALRFNPLPASLRPLHVELGKNAADEKTTAALIRAICQKGQNGSLPVIDPRILDSGDRQVTSALIMGLGRMRSRESLETLMSYMVRLPLGRRIAHMDEFRTSLALLTGTDNGMDSNAWLKVGNGGDL